MSLLMRLERTSTAELIEHLKDAAASRNLAKIEAIRLEFNRRPDREQWSIPWRTTFGKLEFPQAVAARRAIGRIGSMAMFSEQRFLEASTGRATNPADLMTAARLDGRKAGFLGYRYSLAGPVQYTFQGGTRSM
jgi:hypothetical protein